MTHDEAIHDIEILKAENTALKKRLAKAESVFREISKQHRDRLMEHVMGGLAARWSFGEEGTSAARLAQQGEKLVEAVLAQRRLWEAGESVNQPRPPKAAVPKDPIL